jgi:hypothetical protein
MGREGPPASSLFVLTPTPSAPPKPFLPQAKRYVSLAQHLDALEPFVTPQVPGVAAGPLSFEPACARATHSFEHAPQGPSRGWGPALLMAPRPLPRPWP